MCTGFCVDTTFQLILGKYQRVHLARLCGKTLFMFGFVRNCQTCLPGWLYHFPFLPAMTPVSVVPHPHQHSLLSVFWILTILIGVYWYLILYLQFPSDIMLSIFSYVYLPSVCLIWWSYLFRYFVLLKIGLFFLLLSLRDLCIFWI